jgi:hypothetical protein
MLYDRLLNPDTFEVEISKGSVAQKEKPSLPMISQMEEGGESVSKLV